MPEASFIRTMSKALPLPFSIPMHLLSGIIHNKMHLIPFITTKISTCTLQQTQRCCIGFMNPYINLHMMNLWTQDLNTRLTIPKASTVFQLILAKFPGIIIMLEYICYQLFNADPFIITPGVKCNIIQPSIVDYYIVDPSKLPYQ